MGNGCGLGGRILLNSLPDRQTACCPASMVSRGPPEPIAAHPSIHEAVYSPNLDLDAVEAIIKEDPSCLNSVNSQSGYVPLHESARRAHSGLIQLLIRCGADLEVRWKNGETAFLIACQVRCP